MEPVEERLWVWFCSTLMVFHMLMRPGLGVVPGMGLTPPPGPASPTGPGSGPLSTPRPRLGGSRYAPIQFSIKSDFCLTNLCFQSLFSKCLTISLSSQSYKFDFINFLECESMAWLLISLLIFVLDGIVWFSWLWLTTLLPHSNQGVRNTSLPCKIFHLTQL